MVLATRTYRENYITFSKEVNSAVAPGRFQMQKILSIDHSQMNLKTKGPSITFSSSCASEILKLMRNYIRTKSVTTEMRQVQVFSTLAQEVSSQKITRMELFRA